MPYEVLDSPGKWEILPPEEPKSKPWGGLGDLAAGAVRGAGSIGATLLTPYDLLAGNTKSIGNPERRAGMDSGLKEMGADPNSIAYAGGKLGGEIAGTAGMGGMLARPIAGVLPNLSQAIGSAGFTTGGGMAARMAGGAITGGASAGLVNPEDATTGAAIGAILPPALKGAGSAGGWLGNKIRGPEVPPDALAAIKAARDAGYVIPPTQAKPTLVNRMLEGFSGKITTAQNASAKNTEVTNRLAADALGIASGVPITPQVLDGVRKAAGRHYDAVASTGAVSTGQAYESAIDAIVAPFKKAAAGFPNAKPNPIITEIESLKSSSFDAGAAVEKLKEIRSLADEAYGAKNKLAGAAYKDAARAIEDALDTHLVYIGAPAQTLSDFRDARKLIAKTYTVQNALNPTTGTVDARKLGAALNKGKPLTDELLQTAEFANRFPKAAQTVEKMGSLPQTSPLDWAALGAIGAVTSSPMALAGVMARPAARGLLYSDFIQNRLANPQTQGLLSGLLADPEITQWGYRAAPLLGGDR